MQALN